MYKYTCINTKKSNTPQGGIGGDTRSVGSASSCSSAACSPLPHCTQRCAQYQYQRTHDSCQWHHHNPPHQTSTIAARPTPPQWSSRHVRSPYHYLSCCCLECNCRNRVNCCNCTTGYRGCHGSSKARCATEGVRGRSVAGPTGLERRGERG